MVEIDTAECDRRRFSYTTLMVKQISNQIVGSRDACVRWQGECWLGWVCSAGNVDEDPAKARQQNNTVVD